MKENKKFLFFLLLFTIFLLIIFRNWFTPTNLSSGDWIYYWPQFIKQIRFLSAWDIRNIGTGGSMLPTLWLEAYTTSTIHVESFLGWMLYERLFWFFPYLCFACISSFLLYTRFFKDKNFALLASGIFIANTYALMLIGGGQVGIALAYAFSGICFILFDNFIKKVSFKNSIILGLGFSLLAILDIRIVYIVIVALFLYVPFVFSEIKKNVISIISYSCLAGILVIGIHMFWLLPTILSHGSSFGQFGSVYTSAQAVQFFSFATFENALGLLHPNWPLNIFGKVSFMNPIFLILPLFAFSSLFFVDKKDKTYNTDVLYFCFLGLLGIFLSKGTNAPFGTIYLFLFQHFPGFILFRDPTKWYLLIVFSYSMLIPFALRSIYLFLKSKRIISRYTDYLFLVVSICLFVLLIEPALAGQLTGTFQSHILPNDYKQLTAFLETNRVYARTLWMPTTDKFGFISTQHPAISAYDYFNVTESSEVLTALRGKNEEEQLQNAAIRYVILPEDSEKTIFTKDNVYNLSVYRNDYRALQNIPWLIKIKTFGEIIVYEVPQTKDHIWITPSKQSDIMYQELSQTRYTVSLKNVHKGDRLIFVDSYDPLWELLWQKQSIHSKPFGKQMNSFILPSGGNYTVTLFYAPQKWVSWGLSISMACLLLAIIGLVWTYAKEPLLGLKKQK